MESSTFKYEGERNEHMLLYEQVFGDVFERRESKYRAVLMKHRRKLNHSPKGSATKNQK